MAKNVIVKENELLGSPSTEWDINGMGDASIQGFGHDISIAQGETIHFRINTLSVDYRIDIYRMGYYQGMGARKVDSIVPSALLPQIQPKGIFDQETKLYDCGNWTISASWKSRIDSVSGIYFARLVRQDVQAPTLTANSSGAHAYGKLGHGRLANALAEPHASHIFFLVRDDHGKSDILFQTADTTWQAYNRYGGHSLYAEYDPQYPRGHGHQNDRAFQVSYNRPFDTREYRAVNMPWNAEYPFVRWLERNGYDVSYTSGVDTARRGELLLTHKLFLSVAHDEYWSGEQRRHVEAARDAGVHLGFFSGNEVFWKIRWEDSVFGKEQDGDDSSQRTDDAPTANKNSNWRTMVCYKETHDREKIDPNPDEWTGTWRDDCAKNPHGPQPENALTGTIFTVNAWRNDPLIVPAEFGKLRLWRNTRVADLQPGEQAILSKGLLGHEWDEDIDNGYRPPGLFRLSETTIDNVWYLQDEGTNFDAGSATHHLTLYRHSSGALVFGAGTVQWSWGLDGHHDTDTGVPPERANPASTRVGYDLTGPDRIIQQATVNLFADMGIQPMCLQKDLVAAEISTDSKPPISTLSFPPSHQGTTFVPLGVATTFSGTAYDVGGGVVAGIEVSFDNGQSWHPAQGRETWQCAWTPEALGVYFVSSRAVDDSGNIEKPKRGTSVTVQ